MSENRLGDRVDVDQILEDDLPFPGKEAPAAFAGAQSMDAPFGVTAGNTAAAKKPGLDVGNYDPSKPVSAPLPQMPQPAAQAAAPAQADATPPVAKKPDAKNMSMQLRRFREAFGVKRINTKAHTITRVTPDGSEKVDFTFQFRIPNYEDYQWAIVKAEQYSTAFRVPPVFALHFAVVAISVCALDVNLEKGARPTPLHEVFSLEVHDSHVRDPYFPSVMVRAAVADLFFDELLESFYDVVDELHTVAEEYILSHSRALNEEKEKEGPLA